MTRRAKPARPPRPLAGPPSSLRLPAALLRLVDGLARLESRSRADMLRELIRRGLRATAPPAAGQP